MPRRMKQPVLARKFQLAGPTKVSIGSMMGSTIGERLKGEVGGGCSVNVMDLSVSRMMVSLAIKSFFSAVIRYVAEAREKLADPL